MNDELRALIIQVIREEVEFDQKTSTEYTGAMDGGSLYRNMHTIIVKVGGEILTTISLD